MIELGGVDGKGHDAIYNYLKQINHKVTAIAVFERFRLVSKSFVLKDSAFQLFDHQLKHWDDDESKKWKFIAKLD